MGLTYLLWCGDLYHMQGFLDGKRKRRTAIFTDDFDRAISDSKSSVDKSTTHRKRAHVHPVVLVIPGPNSYGPKHHRGNSMSGLYSVNLYQHPVSYRLENNVLIPNPTKIELVRVIEELMG